MFDVIKHVVNVRKRTGTRTRKSQIDNHYVTSMGTDNAIALWSQLINSAARGFVSALQLLLYRTL